MDTQRFSRLSVIRSLVVLVLSTALFSFTGEGGGDTYAIYLNDKVVVKEHVMASAAVKNIALADSNVGDVLRIHYSHCGKTGIGRSMAIHGKNNQVVKKWRFDDNAQMQIDVTELLALPNSPDMNLKLVYTCKEIPEGKMLATVMISDQNRAALN